MTNFSIILWWLLSKSQWLKKSILHNGQFLLETSKKVTNCDHVTADTATNGKSESVLSQLPGDNQKRDHKYVWHLQHFVMAASALWAVKY